MTGVKDEPLALGERGLQPAYPQIGSWASAARRK
jgi:hypothetical protein